MIRYNRFIRKCMRINYSTRAEIDAPLKEQFESNEYKPRKHPGSVRIKIASLPPNIVKAINIVINDYNAKSFYEDSKKLNNYIISRRLPPEEKEIDAKARKLFETLSEKAFSDLPELSQEEKEETTKLINNKVFRHLKRNVYGWANINYDLATSLQYLIARSAPEYAVLIRIFDEIHKKHPDYKPRSFFDFGSGVGTGTWAINKFWKEHIFEYFCVDTSSDMHDLARLILCDGKDNVEMPHKAYFQRQFLPASSTTKYDIVLSAFTLFELPDMKSRLEAIQKLWNKTEHYLIIVEQGSLAGFKIVNEAREFVLSRPTKRNFLNGHVFSPCPNDNVCPRYLEQETPCNFLMKYQTLPVVGKSEIGAELYSYVVLRKGKRCSDDPQWPRVVRAPIVRSGHTVCRLCTFKGELKEIIFSKGKHDKITYRCARSCNWGDELPIKI